MTPPRDASGETVEHMRAVQDRLRGLIRASELIISGLDLVPVLQHIVEAAAGLVGAQYCALGVLDPAGGLAEFVHTGMDRATVDRIGHRPEGKGLVGALIDEPKTIRLASSVPIPDRLGFLRGIR